LKTERWGSPLVQEKYQEEMPVTGEGDQGPKGAAAPFMDRMYYYYYYYYYYYNSMKYTITNTLLDGKK